MTPKRPRGEESGSEPGTEASVRSASIRRDGPPPEDTAFMEEVLRELSEQNEQARVSSAERPAEPPPAAEAGSVPRPRTVRVERDSEFRTPEGVPSARAYLPARTLAPGRAEPVDPETVRVNDPRKLPTLRLPRPKKKEASPDSGAPSGRARRNSLPDDNAPTLRSAAQPVNGARRPEITRWIGWVVAAAITGALVVALAARFRASPPRPSAPRLSQVTPSELEPARSGSPSPASASVAAPSSRNVAPTAASSVPSAPPRRAKSDRWF
jgi:hypothetical protein